jgi:hypothetical protein
MTDLPVSHVFMRAKTRKIDNDTVNGLMAWSVGLQLTPPYPPGEDARNSRSVWRGSPTFLSVRRWTVPEVEAAMSKPGSVFV